MSGGKKGRLVCQKKKKKKTVPRVRGLAAIWEARPGKRYSSAEKKTRIGKKRPGWKRDEPSKKPYPYGGAGAGGSSGNKERVMACEGLGLLKEKRRDVYKIQKHR